MMNTGNAPLGRDNIDIFIDTYSPSAYKSSYRVLADATRTEMVLIDSFVEAFHQRNVHTDEDPVFVFADILEDKVRALSDKYPVPDHVVISDRSLDEFTKSTIKAEVHKRINSISFRAMDLLMSSGTSSQLSTKTSGFISLLSEAGKMGINLMLVLQVIIISVVIFLSAHFISMSVFDVGALIDDDPFSGVRKNSFLNVDALIYMPIQMQKGIFDEEMITAQDKGAQDASNASNPEVNAQEDNTVPSSAIAGDNQDNTTMDGSNSTTVADTPSDELETTDPSLSATRG
ncbi:MAG TPA: hypothetical protein GXZ67_09090 [Clostridiaceae bacterium]|nr:hypothetical protein [Clostridiaceae bacterium]